MTFGVDYAWGRPGGAELADAGVAFAARYLSHDRTGKTLSRAEADDLQSHGVQVVSVFEDGAKRPLDGYQAGRADAAFARSLADACGQPGDVPIYFAADWDVAENEQQTLNNYLQGAVDVLGGAHLVGVYGGYYAVKRAMEAGVAHFGWQTTGWSGGQWYDGAHIRQVGGTITLGGVECDKNTAMADNFGQWHPVAVVPPFPGRIMMLTDPHMHGSDIVQLQRRFRERGWNIGTFGPDKDGVDGDFGKVMDQVVRAFQKEKFPDDPKQWDGKVGRLTWDKLWTAPVTP